MAYQYIEILGEVHILPDGNMHWIAGCWPSKTSRDAGDPPGLVSDFVSNANKFAGTPHKRRITRVGSNGLEYQLASGEWIGAADLAQYPTIDYISGPNSRPNVTSAPALAYTAPVPVSDDWVMRDMHAQMRIWLKKQGDRTGDITDPGLVFGPRHPTAKVSPTVRDMAKGLEDDKLPVVTHRSQPGD